MFQLGRRSGKPVNDTVNIKLANNVFFVDIIMRLFSQLVLIEDRKRVLTSFRRLIARSAEQFVCGGESQGYVILCFLMLVSTLDARSQL